jgi:hypothetical protein
MLQLLTMASVPVLTNCTVTVEGTRLYVVCSCFMPSFECLLIHETCLLLLAHLIVAGVPSLEVFPSPIPDLFLGAPLVEREKERKKCVC